MTDLQVYKNLKKSKNQILKNFKKIDDSSISSASLDRIDTYNNMITILSTEHFEFMKKEMINMGLGGSSYINNLEAIYNWDINHIVNLDAIVYLHLPKPTRGQLQEMEKKGYYTVSGTYKSYLYKNLTKEEQSLLAWRYYNIGMYGKDNNKWFPKSLLIRIIDEAFDKQINENKQHMMENRDTWGDMSDEDFKEFVNELTYEDDERDYHLTIAIATIPMLDDDDIEIINKEYDIDYKKAKIKFDVA